MREKVEKKERGSEYLALALYAFGGLGIEVIYAYLLEPFLYGHGMQEFTVTESVCHWMIICITWGLAHLFTKGSIGAGNFWYLSRLFIWNNIPFTEA